METRRDAASPWFIHLASHPKETHRPGASRRRGETPHLRELSLIAICDRASNSKQHNKLRRFTKRLRYRCGMSFALLNRPHPTRRDRTSLRPRATPVPSMETRLPAASNLPRCPSGSVAPRRTFTILARKQIIGSVREKRMESDFLVNCSTPFLVPSRSDGAPCGRQLPAALPPKRSCL